MRSGRGVDVIDPAHRFWSKVDRDPIGTGCWIWQGAKDPSGYGAFKLHGRKQSAHRVVLTLVGRAPGPTDHADHLCRNRACVCPAHLQWVSQRTNTLRGTSPVAVNTAKTHCIRGHEFTPENTRVRRRRGRECVACKRIRDQKRLEASQ